ncbi:MAG TPA: hypothetical protein VLG12_02685 [Candidatus Saccharimonadales bacterium]|nr:hypothetical protein [Candidatus Saccharimonadales bacterium]
MAIAEQLLVTVRNAFDKLKIEDGYTIPTKAANILSDGDPDIQKALAREILYHPTKDFLYPNVICTLEYLLRQRDKVKVWTDDYRHRPVSTYFGKTLRKELPPEQRANFSLVHAEDKIALLPSLFEKIQLSGLRNIFIVDNNPDNIHKASLVAASANNTMTYHLIWINPQASFPMTELSSLSPEIPVTTVQKVADLSLLRKDLIHYGKHQGENAMWIFDFNETLLDTPAWEKSLTYSVATNLQLYSDNKQIVTV